MTRFLHAVRRAFERVHAGWLVAGLLAFIAALAAAPAQTHHTVQSYSTADVHAVLQASPFAAGDLPGAVQFLTDMVSGTWAGAYLTEAFDVLYQLLAALPLVGMAYQTNALSEADQPSNTKYRDVSNRLTRKKPNKSPLFVLLRNLRKGEPAKSSKIEWFESDVPPRNTTVDGGTTAGGAGSAQTISVSDGIYIKDDLVQLPDNSNSPGAILKVVSVAANGTDVDFVRVDGGDGTSWGTVPATSDGEFMRRIGNMKEEGYSKSDPTSIEPTDEYNYCARSDRVIQQTMTRKATEDYAGDSWQDNRDRQIWDWQTSEEEKLFFSKRQHKSISGSSWHSMGGIDFFNLPKSYSYSASSLTVADAIEMVRDTFVGNDGSDVRYCHAGSKLITDFMQLQDDKVDVNQVESALLQRRLPEWRIGEWRVRFIHEELFDERNQPRLGYFLDYENLAIRELNPMKIIPLDLERTEGTDAEAIQIKGEWSLECRYLETHAKVEGSS
jgi:hypothetical protein